MRTTAFVIVTAVLCALAVVRVGRWALAEPAPVVVPTTTTTSTTVLADFIDGPIVVRRPISRRSWTWDELARCESSNRWSVTRGVYQGGLQFDARTWDRYVNGFPGYPADAHLATREQQISVAEQVLAREGLDAWPTCGPRMG